MKSIIRLIALLVLSVVACVGQGTSGGITSGRSLSCGEGKQSVERLI